MQTAKTLIRLGGCPGWSESSLGNTNFIGFVMLRLICSVNNLSCEFRKTNQALISMLCKSVGRFSQSETADIYVVQEWRQIQTARDSWYLCCARVKADSQSQRQPMLCKSEGRFREPETADIYVVQEWRQVQRARDSWYLCCARVKAGSDSQRQLISMLCKSAGWFRQPETADIYVVQEWRQVLTARDSWYLCCARVKAGSDSQRQLISMLCKSAGWFRQPKTADIYVVQECRLIQTARDSWYLCCARVKAGSYSQRQLISMLCKSEGRFRQPETADIYVVQMCRQIQRARDSWYLCCARVQADSDSQRQLISMLCKSAGWFRQPETADIYVVQEWRQVQTARDSWYLCCARVQAGSDSQRQLISMLCKSAGRFRQSETADIYVVQECRLIQTARDSWYLCCARVQADSDSQRQLISMLCKSAGRFRQPETADIYVVQECRQIQTSRDSWYLCCARVQADSDNQWQLLQKKYVSSPSVCCFNKKRTQIIKTIWHKTAQVESQEYSTFQANGYQAILYKTYLPTS